ncbi:MAG: galactokinase [Gemmatimonadaceae bacterium]
MTVAAGGREAVEALFTMAYGHRPAAVASAPGRVNLIGEHTDYNGGEVLPIAIAQRTWVAIAPARGEGSRAVSREVGEAGAWGAAYTRATGAWWDYVAGALREASSLGARPAGHDVAVVSDVPMGAGLSSSAALEVATVAAAVAMEGTRVVRTNEAGAVSLRDVALAAHRAESGFVGVACGIMDQFASALCEEGHALHLHCDTAETRSIPFRRGVLIVDTVSPRALVHSEFNTRRAECAAALEILRQLDPSIEALAHVTPELLERAALPDPIRKRARHVVAETRRVQDFVRRCEAAGGRAGVGTEESREAIGLLLNASHRSLRDDYQCSSPELDWVVEHCVARIGIDGARLTGAGWGGCAIVVGDAKVVAEFSRELAETFELSWGRSPRIWLTSPDAGARIER